MIKNLRIVFGMMKKKRYFFLVSVIIASMSIVGIRIFNSYVYKNVVNTVFNSEVKSFSLAIKLSCLSLILICIISPLTSFFSMYLCNKTSCEIRTELYNHLVKLPLVYFEENTGGDILSKLTNDFNVLKAIYDRQLYEVILLIMNGSCALITIIMLDFRLAILIIIIGILSLFINVLYVKPVRVFSDKIQANLSKVSERFIDVYFGNRVTKLFNAEKIMLNKFSRENKYVLTENMKLIKKEAQRDVVNYMFSTFSLISVLGVGALMVTYKMVDPGTVIAIFSLQDIVVELFVGLGVSVTNLQKSLAGAERIFSFMNEGTEPEIIKEYKFISRNDDTIITMKNVDFSYDGKKKVIDNLNLDIKKGEILALVGKSGSGKSTILKLLLGLYKPQKGEVLLNDKKNSELTLSQLRDRFAYVAQEAYLFNFSIEENILLEQENISYDSVVNAAKSADAHDFIMGLNDKYKTMGGENSSKLSGGQRQRVALARALIRNRKILLLDEVTSGVDGESQDYIFNEIYNKQGDITTIVCAHRLSTVENADRIIVIDEGKIVGSGRHSDLLQNNKIYKMLYESQFNYV